MPHKLVQQLISQKPQSINFILFKYKMKKTANFLHQNNPNYLHSNHSTQPYKKGLLTFQSCIPLNEKSRLTPCREQILEQACSTTFTSKIFQFSHCQSKDISSAISPAKSQTEIQNKKKKINVTASLVKMKTEATESFYPKLMSSIHPIEGKEEMQQSNKKMASTNDKNKKCVTLVNPEKSFDHKQQILKKLGGRKTSEIKYPLADEFSSKLKEKLHTQIIEGTQTKDCKKLMSNKLQLKENSSILRSEKRINHMRRRNLQLEREQNLGQNYGQKIKTESDGSWVVLRDSTGFCGSGNKKEKVETPINKLLDEEQQMYFRKAKFFCDK